MKDITENYKDGIKRKHPLNMGNNKYYNGEEVMITLHPLLIGTIKTIHDLMKNMLTYQLQYCLRVNL